MIKGERRYRSMRENVGITMAKEKRIEDEELVF
jgi:hypothetical protein